MFSQAKKWTHKIFLRSTEQNLLFLSLKVNEIRIHKLFFTVPLKISHQIKTTLDGGTFHSTFQG